MKTTALKWGLLSSLLLGACASDISPDSARDEDHPVLPELPGPGGEHAAFSQASAGYYRVEVDLAGDDWVYLDLDTQTQVFPLDPAASDEWDLAHRGSDIKLNGGVSGAPPSGHEVLIHGDKVVDGQAYPWTSVNAAPPPSAVDYHSDTAGSGLLGGNPANPVAQPDYAFSVYPEADEEPRPVDGAGDYGWFHYSGYLDGSVVTVRENVAYVLRTVQCGYISLRLTAYTSGQSLSYDLQPVSGPECAVQGGGEVAELGKATFSSSASATVAQVDASDENAWVYLDLLNALQVQPGNPADDMNWDVALRRTDIKMNGGESGSQGVALHDMLRGDWSIGHVPQDADFHLDEMAALAFVSYPPEETQASGACGNINGDFGWYYYSGFCNDGDGVHHISPRDVVYVLKARGDQYFKLRVLSYYNEDGESAQLKFEYEPIGG